MMCTTIEPDLRDDVQVLVHLKFKEHLHVARIDNYISNDALRIKG